jgi:hypothetical protein
MIDNNEFMQQQRQEMSKLKQAPTAGVVKKFNPE